MAETEEAQFGVPIVSTTAILADKQNQIFEHEHDTALQGGVPIIDSKDVKGSEVLKDDLNDVAAIDDNTSSRPEAPSLHDSAIESSKDHAQHDATIDAEHTATSSLPNDAEPPTGISMELVSNKPTHDSTSHASAGSEIPSHDAGLLKGEPPSQLDDTIGSNHVSAGLTIPASVVDIPTQHAEADLAHGQTQGFSDHHDPMGAEAAAQYDLPDQFADEQDLEVDDNDENDSTMGGDTESLTTSLSSSIYHYRKEHGRTYHAYKDGKYIFPNDEREASRLDLQHHLFRMTFNQQLYFAPVTPRHALDIGTGTGIWAIDLADLLPECQVVGIDLSPGQPTMVPPNLKFIVDDAEDLWLYQDKFDLIHARLMAGSIADWPKFYRQAYDNLEPGGWLEIQDYGLPVRSTDGTHEGTDIHRWGVLLCEASAKMGRPMGSDACDLYAQQMRDAGFVDIQERMFMWPSNTWPRDPFMKELGKWNMINCLDGLEGFCLALFTRALGWRKEEVDVFVANITRDFKDRRIHAYFPMPVIFGRKPYEHERVLQ